MRLKINKIYSKPEIFEEIIFTSGVNLILGEKVESDSVVKGKKTNGVGKSMCIEFINFCLLKKPWDSRVMRIPNDKVSLDTKIILDLEINNKKITISRSLEEPDKPTILSEGSITNFANLEDANLFLKDLLFTNITDFPQLSFREFISPFFRDEESEFKDILACFDLKKRIPPLIKPHAFLFNLDTTLISRIEKKYKEIERVNTHKKEVLKQLTENESLKVSEVKSTLNSLNDDLKKIDNTIDSFKTNKAFESIEEELNINQLEIENVRTKQKALRYELKKIKSLPSPEMININEISILYEQFKTGLGDIVEKSLEEVMEFKNKIDEFQNRLINEKSSSIEDELNILSEKLELLETERINKYKLIDQKGVLKDIKSGYAIYHEKKDKFSRLEQQYDSYSEAETRWKELKTAKDQLFLELDKNLFDAKKIIENFNQTIIDIHSYIMDSNEASLEIKTINKGKNKQILLFDMRIDDDGSHSIDRTKVFIYDLALLFNDYTNSRHPKILVHDNIFDVDQDTLIKSLNFLAIKDNQKFQYILTLNRDKIENEERKNLLNLNIEEHTVASFTKQKRFLFGEKYSEL